MGGVAVGSTVGAGGRCHGDDVSVSPSAAPSSAEPSSAAPSSAPGPSAGAAVAPNTPVQKPGTSQGQPGHASRGSSQGSAPKDENRTKDSESAGEQTKDTGVAKQESRGSVNAETSIVTKADGSQVRIVGKTADGRDCELPAAALKEAQKASAEGRLAHTGAQAGTAVMVGAGALALGVLALLVARRRRAA